jgi:hypothetical protein
MLLWVRVSERISVLGLQHEGTEHLQTMRPRSPTRAHTGFTHKGVSSLLPWFGKGIGSTFAKHLKRRDEFDKERVLRSGGLESTFVNEVLKRSDWSVGSSWKWTGSSHINVLELASALQAVKKSAQRGGGRTCLFLDSNVAASVLAKGRSSAKSLSALLRKLLPLEFTWQFIFAPLG